MSSVWQTLYWRIQFNQRRVCSMVFFVSKCLKFVNIFIASCKIDWLGTVSLGTKHRINWQLYLLGRLRMLREVVLQMIASVKLSNWETERPKFSWFRWTRSSSDCRTPLNFRLNFAVYFSEKWSKQNPQIAGTAS